MTADPALMNKLISEEQQQTRLLLGEIQELMNVSDVSDVLISKHVVKHFCMKFKVKYVYTNIFLSIIALFLRYKNKCHI